MADNLQMLNTAKAIYKSPNVVCPKCGSKVFREAIILKKLPALVSPTGKEELYPIPVYVCDKCGTIPDEFVNKSAAKEILGETEEKKEESSILIK